MKLRNITLKTKLIMVSVIGNGLMLLLTIMSVIVVTNVYNRALELMMKLGEESLEEISELARFSAANKLFIGVLGCISLIANITIITSIIFDVVRGFRSIKQNMEIISTGDLSHAMSEKMLNRRDDFGMLSNSIEQMRNSLCSLIFAVQNNSLELENMVNSINQSMRVLNSSIGDVTATTEELSANMEETSVAATEVNYMAKDIESASKSVADKAEEGSSLAGDIHSKAIKAKENISDNRNKMSTQVATIQQKLEKALEATAVVEKIDTLTEAIMDIAEQTSLLSLNASIEAARAGESGKGFAVVASEIGSLSDQSNKAANNIKDVVAGVSEAVKDLTENSNALMQFVNRDFGAVLTSFADFAEQYDADATKISGILSDFLATSEELLSSVTSIGSNIGNVSRSNESCAIGITAIADKTVVAMGESSNIVKEVSNANDKANDLLTEIGKFKLENKICN